MDLGSLRLLPNCPKGHKVIGICDEDFVVCEVHLPAGTSLKEIDQKVREFLGAQL